MWWMMQTEQTLIKQAKSGDRQAINDIMVQHWPTVYRFVLQKTCDKLESQDITQETFIRAFKSLNDYRLSNQKFISYLLRIAYNMIIDDWRRKKNKPTIVDIDEYRHKITDGENLEQQVINNENCLVFERILQKLPLDQYRTIELRIIDGLSVKETAQILNKSEAAIKMLQQRALKQLKSLMLDSNAIATGKSGCD